MTTFSSSARHVARLPLGAVAVVLTLASGARADEPASTTPEGPAPGAAIYDANLALDLRYHEMSDVPLMPLPGDTTGELGQNRWLSSWVRLGGHAGWHERARFVAQLDLFDGVVAGDVTEGVSDAARPRDDREFYSAVRPRWLYLEWTPSFGQFRVGQMGSHWGLGLVANDGDHERPFGHNRYGDIVERVMFMTRPLGRTSPFFVASSIDVVFRDQLADLTDGDLAVQGVLALGVMEPERALGLYGVYRHQRNDLDDKLDVGVVDLYGRWNQRLGSATGYVAAEGALIAGRTSFGRTTTRESHDVRQALGAVHMGYESEQGGVVLEVGATTGDANGEDAVQRGATMDPDHRVGLVLFPEVLAWHSARTAAWARDEGLAGRPARGSELLPNDGGVSGAGYLFPHGNVRPLPWLDVRFGAVVAWKTAPSADAYRQRAYSESVGPLGGDPTNRFLGVELSSAVVADVPVSGRFRLRNGIEGGVLLPGSAFDTAGGAAMDPAYLVRATTGLRF